MVPTTIFLETTHRNRNILSLLLNRKQAIFLFGFPHPVPHSVKVWSTSLSMLPGSAEIFSFYIKTFTIKETVD